ncbi:hypothetical protein AAFF_G00221080 [Aldrovandia affinis]|uniref:Uncharacterized protein n=1 Tax=Aldrovandia affinis TaxID=143900 RepID=A0AAD7RFM1_9TELE|nr:hypothetical protein AAFF_G00221080 [Aldrovandia affinis]
MPRALERPASATGLERQPHPRHRVKPHRFGKKLLWAWSLAMSSGQASVITTGATGEGAVGFSATREAIRLNKQTDRSVDRWPWHSLCPGALPATAQSMLGNLTEEGLGFGSP